MYMLDFIQKKVFFHIFDLKNLKKKKIIHERFFSMSGKSSLKLFDNSIKIIKQKKRQNHANLKSYGIKKKFRKNGKVFSGTYKEKRMSPFQTNFENILFSKRISLEEKKFNENLKEKIINCLEKSADGFFVKHEGKNRDSDLNDKKFLFNKNEKIQRILDPQENIGKKSEKEALFLVKKICEGFNKIFSNEGVFF